MNLKKFLYKLTPVFISIFVFMSCEDVEAPDFCYELVVVSSEGARSVENPVTMKEGESLRFNSCSPVGSADFYAFFSGKEGSEYEKYINPKTPEDSVTEGEGARNAVGDFEELYTDSGVYVATIVLTNRSRKDPKKKKQVIADYTITVEPAN